MRFIHKNEMILRSQQLVSLFLFLSICILNIFFLSFICVYSSELCWLYAFIVSRNTIYVYIICVYLDTRACTHQRINDKFAPSMYRIHDLCVFCVHVTPNKMTTKISSLYDPYDNSHNDSLTVVILSLLK